MPANLYDYPRYYDLVFGSDWKAEFDFLQLAFKEFGRSKVRRVFEPACGTGRLLFRLALAGYDVSGLDLNPRAVDYCNKRLIQRQKSPAVFVGDMANFELPRPVDAAFNMINSFRHLLSEKHAIGHLRCIARSLEPGGIYVLGLHLTPTEGTAISEERWSARRGHLGINTHLATHDLDLTARTEHCTMTMDVYTPTRIFQIVDELIFRTYTWPQMQALIASVKELEMIAVFDFRYEINIPVEIKPETQDVVLILRRK
jgi:SAM-dependent methyltransferase